jgi:hypothetical protein
MKYRRAARMNSHGKGLKNFMKRTPRRFYHEASVELRLASSLSRGSRRLLWLRHNRPNYADCPVSPLGI